MLSRPCRQPRLELELRSWPRRDSARRQDQPHSENRASCGAVVVVGVPPSGRDGPAVTKSIKDLGGEALAMEASAEVLGKAVVPRSRSHRLSTSLFTMRPHRLAQRKDRLEHWPQQGGAGNGDVASVEVGGCVAMDDQTSLR